MTTKTRVETESETTIAENNAVAIPFDKLRRSDENMRTIHPQNTPEDEQLLSSIRANGILQNLIVYPASKDTFKVPAGGRRFGALEYMVENGEIPKDFAVNCLVIDSKDATDLSLVENFQRLAPHPADTFKAFEALINNGASIKDISRTYGITEAQVNRTLRLAGLHPELFELFKRNELGLEHVMAYAATADQALQIATFKVLGESTSISSERIKNALNDNRCSSNTALAKLVTMDTYIKAGGAFEDDLFTNVSNLFDLELLIKLAEQKLQGVADKLTGWRWVEVTLEGNHNLFRYGRIPHLSEDVPSDVAAKMQTMKDRIDVLDEIDWGDQSDDEAEEYEHLQEMLDGLTERVEEYRTYDPSDMEYAGCIVTFDQSTGEVIIAKGLMTNNDTADYNERDKKPEDQSSKGSGDSSPEKDQAPTLSAALVTDLGKYRRSIIRTALAGNATVARDLWEFQLCRNVFAKLKEDYSDYYFRPLDISVTLSTDETSIGDYKETQPAQDMANLFGKLDTSWASKHSSVKSFDDFRALSAKERSTQLAYAISLTLSYGNDYCGDEKFMKHIMGELGVTLHESFRPTEINYFSRLTKPMLLEHGRKWFGKTWVKDNESNKKATLVERLHELFHGKNDTLNKNQQRVRDTWIPPEMK